MEKHVLNCPNCGGKLEFEDGLDTFFVILWIQGYN